MDHIQGNHKAISLNPVAGHMAAPQMAKTNEVNANGADKATTELGAWYHEAHNYYNDVMNGTQPMPDQASWNEFMAQFDWAKGQIFGSGRGAGVYDPNSLGSAGDDFASPQIEAPAGAYVNQRGEFIYDTESAQIFYDGDPTTVHSFATDNRLDIPSMAARVEMVTTKDSETGGRDILKVKITYADGSEKILTFDNYEMDGFVLDIHGANLDNVKIPDSLKGKVSVQKYKANEGSADTQASLSGKPVQGEAIEGVENGAYYEADTNVEVFRFLPKAGEDQVHQVVGNWDISIPLSSEAAVFKSADPSFDYVIEVTHKDGSKDVYYIKEDFQGNINGLKGSIQFHPDILYNSAALPLVVDEEKFKIPESLGEFLTVNGGEASSAGDVLNTDHPEDTAPVADAQSDYFDSDWNVAVYDDPTVDIHPQQDDGEDRYSLEVHANDLNITLESLRDEITQIVKLSDYYQIIIKFADGTTQIIRVDAANIQNININGGKLEQEVVDSLRANRDTYGVFNITGVTDVEQDLTEREESVMDLAEDLANVNGVNLSVQEIFQIAQDMGISPSTLTDPTDADLIAFLLAIDERLVELNKDLMASSVGTDAGSLASSKIRNHLLELWEILFPDDQWGVGDDDDDVLFNGKGYDIFENDRWNQGIESALRLSRADG